MDRLQDSARYGGLGARFAAGLEWLLRFDPATPDGRIEIDADRVFALVQSYDTTPSESKRYESHRDYADIQFVASGNEVIYYSPVTGLERVTEYDASLDFLLYADPEQSTPLRMSPGQFAIFLPQDAHKPGCESNGPGPVRKVVIKVRLD